METILNWINYHLAILVLPFTLLITWLFSKRFFDKKKLKEVDVSIDFNITKTLSENFNLQQVMYADLEDKISKLRNLINESEIKIDNLKIEIDLKNQLIEELGIEINDFREQRYDK